jgi:hypothetical protein
VEAFRGGHTNGRNITQSMDYFFHAPRFTVGIPTLTSPRLSKPSRRVSSSSMVRWISFSPLEFESYLGGWGQRDRRAGAMECFFSKAN